MKTIFEVCSDPRRTFLDRLILYFFLINQLADGLADFSPRSISLLFIAYPSNLRCLKKQLNYPSLFHKKLVSLRRTLGFVFFLKISLNLSIISEPQHIVLERITTDLLNTSLSESSTFPVSQCEHNYGHNVLGLSFLW